MSIVKKEKVYIWMAGICLLLVMLIVIQLMWVRHTTIIEQRETRMQVMRAIESTEERLRNTNYCLLTYNKIYINRHEGFYMLHQPFDSIRFTGTPDTVHMLTSDELFTNSDSLRFDISTIESVHYPMSAEIQVRFHIEFSDTSDFYNEQREFYKNTNNPLLSKRFANPRDIKAQFNMDVADSVIGRSLAAENIHSKYGFGFIVKDDNRVEFCRRVKDTAALMHSEFSRDFIPDNKFIKPYRLAVVFPDDDGFYKINLWLFISIFIILLLTFSFYKFVRFYLDQKRLSEMKSDLLNNLTHEFNTPIANIALAIETISDDPEAHSEKVDKIIQIISQESARLRNNIDRALQAVSMDKGQIVLRKDEIDLVAIIKTILSSYQLKCEQLGGRIEFIHPKSVIVTADETHLLNCICNLLDNAIKYRRGIPVIAITLTDSPRQITLSIADNGMGMNSETQKHIFEKFYRAHEGDTHNTKGFGLGLHYVKGIIEAHHGRIDVKSKPGNGTTFTITLLRV
ncbi:MAG: hypothetical protein JWO03_3131 [Bacteroidetes bacterium]|nr:hypothetical protein [Bacteroidota bacterium]